MPIELKMHTHAVFGGNETRITVPDCDDLRAKADRTWVSSLVSSNIQDVSSHIKDLAHNLDSAETGLKRAVCNLETLVQRKADEKTVAKIRDELQSSLQRVVSVFEEAADLKTKLGELVSNAIHRIADEAEGFHRKVHSASKEYKLVKDEFATCAEESICRLDSSRIALSQAIEAKAHEFRTNGEQLLARASQVVGDAKAQVEQIQGLHQAAVDAKVMAESAASKAAQISQEITTWNVCWCEQVSQIGSEMESATSAVKQKGEICTTSANQCSLLAADCQAAAQSAAASTNRSKAIRAEIEANLGAVREIRQECGEDRKRVADDLIAIGCMQDAVKEASSRVASKTETVTNIHQQVQSLANTVVSLESEARDHASEAGEAQKSLEAELAAMRTFMQQQKAAVVLLQKRFKAVVWVGSFAALVLVSGIIYLLSTKAPVTATANAPQNANSESAQFEAGAETTAKNGYSGRLEQSP